MTEMTRMPISPLFCHNLSVLALLVVFKCACLILIKHYILIYLLTYVSD